ncbi:MAG: CPXCG motif-containing cysteine-rich protein [Planctomycetota bacterium]
MQEEASYICDHCGEEIVIPLDISAGVEQEYVEDCPVCCSPNVIQVLYHDAEAEVHSEPE